MSIRLLLVSAGAERVTHLTRRLLLTALVGCLPLTAAGQSVNFAGAVSTIFVSTDSAAGPRGLAVDTIGNLFLADYTRVLELPRTATGFGAPITLPTNGLTQVDSLALDSAGNLFVSARKGKVVELPKTGEGYGRQITVPVSGLSSPPRLAIDGAGDLFLLDDGNSRIVELPKTPTGFGPPTNVTSGELSTEFGMAADLSGNVFAFDNRSRLIEIPFTGSGYGSRIILPTTNVERPFGLALDKNQNLYMGSELNKEKLTEIPHTSTNKYGPQVTVPTGRIGDIVAIAIDNGGDIFLSQQTADVGGLLQLQRKTARLANANVCATGKSTPVPCSSSLTMLFQINSDLRLGTPRVLTGGSPDLDFALGEKSTCKGAVTSGTVCAVNVIFAPLSSGKRNGTVDITDDNGVVLSSMPISGTGVAADDAAPYPEVTIRDAQAPFLYLNFDRVPVGTSETLPVSITNVGGGLLTITPSLQARIFKVASSTCQAGMLPGKSCGLEVEFSPVAINDFDSALNLQTNGLLSPSVQLHGSVSGFVPGESTLNFGSVAYGDSAVLRLAVHSRDFPRLVKMSTTTNGPSYTVLKNADNTCQFKQQAGDNCILPVQFSPSAVGEHNGTLTLTASPGGAVTTVVLKGSSGGISVSAKLLEFGTIPVGAKKVLPLTITNVGVTGTIRLGTSFSGPSYTVSKSAPNTCEGGIAAGQSCSLSVEFSPVSVGSHQGRLTVAPTGGAADYKVELFGDGS